MTVLTRVGAVADPPPPHRGPLAVLIGDRARCLGRQMYLEEAGGDRTLSYAALGDAVARWRATLDDKVRGPGAMVAISIADPIDFATVFLAVMAAGHWALPLEPGPPAGGGRLTVTARRPGGNLVVADRPGPETDPFPGGPGATPPPRRGRTGGVVLSSSGTTGEPKIIVLAQEQLLYTAGRIADHHGLTGDDRGFNPLPLFHINAEVVGVLATLVSGASLVTDDRFHRTGFWELMGRHRVTWINAVPAIISLLSEPGPRETVPPGIRFIRSASAPLPVETLRRFEANTGIPVLETYGMTEAASQITANPLGTGRRVGSVGRPVGVEIRVVPDDGPPSPGGPRGRGATGHVEIRGPSVITAYGDAVHGDRFDAGGWLRTGDLGHVDEEGYLYLDGRVDDVINRDGEKMFPSEIEAVVRADPDVVEVAVVAQSHPTLGQVPVAFIVLGQAGEVPGHGAADVVDRIRVTIDSRLPRSKRPVAFHVVARLPVGATGKVRRRLLAGRDVPVPGGLPG